MVGRLNLRHILGVMTLGVVFTFQNCSDPAQEASQNEAASYIEGLPFAYKANLDTIAYMSCSNMAGTFEKRAFFTFRGGSFTSVSGIGVTEEFTEATKYYSLQNKRAAFGDSLANSNTRLQLSLRMANNLQSVATADSTPIDGKSLGNMLGNLSDDPIVSHLATMVPGDLKHYFPSGEASRLLESSLRFNSSPESLSADIRSKMENRELLLSLTFSKTNSTSDWIARGPDPSTVSTTDIHGTGYQVQFGTPLNWATAERRIIQNITEVNLKTGFPAVSEAQWACPTSMQFVMVRTEDIAKVSPCNRTVDSHVSESQRQALEAIRRVLPVEDFYVDVVNRCIVAKPHISSQSCYGNRNGMGDINYSSGSCAGVACPHYVSVCVKLK